MIIFCRARCPACGQDFLVAVSCTRKGVCPTRNARRMAETAGHVVDQVFPPLPVRQLVLSVPKRLRYFLAGAPGVRIEVASRWEVLCEDWASLSPGPSGRWGAAGKEPAKGDGVSPVTAAVQYETPLVPCLETWARTPRVTACPEVLNVSKARGQSLSVPRHERAGRGASAQTDGPGGSSSAAAPSHIPAGHASALSCRRLTLVLARDQSLNEAAQSPDRPPWP